MTATTLHTVSRLLAEWERAELVSLGRKRVAVLATKELAHLTADPESDNFGFT